jgi:hypothetical protein
MQEQYFEDVKENFQFQTESQYMDLCNMYEDWKNKQILEELRNDINQCD